MLLANISRELVESGISCTSVIHITLSTLNQCTMHKLFLSLVNSKKQEKKLLSDNNNNNRRIPLSFTLSSIYSTIASGPEPFFQVKSFLADDFHKK